MYDKFNKNHLIIKNSKYKIISIDRLIKLLTLINNNHLKIVLYNKNLYSLTINNCIKINYIPYLSNIKELILQNQPNLIYIPDKYSNQLIYLKIENCRWLKNFYMNYNINNWFLYQNDKFTKKIINKKKNNIKYSLINYYDIIFDRLICYDILINIIEFV